MQKFYYNEIKGLTDLLQELNVVLDKYNKKEMDLFAFLLLWMDKSIRWYKEQGQAEKESRLQMLKAEFVTAQRNINPITFEKITLHRHELHSIIAFKVIQAAEGLLRSDLHADKERVQQAIELTTQVLVAGIQSGIITNDMMQKTLTQDDLEAMWHLLSTDANIALGQKRILLIVSIYDVWILLHELMEGLKN